MCQFAAGKASGIQSSHRTVEGLDKIHYRVRPIGSAALREQIDQEIVRHPGEHGRGMSTTTPWETCTGLRRLPIGRISNEDLEGHENSQAAEEPAPLRREWAARFGSTPIERL